MAKIYTVLGLMSGTSMDGVDASIIQTDGKSEYKAILDKYFAYPENIYNDLTTLRDKIKISNDLKKLQKEIKSIEKDITIFHAESVEKILKKTWLNVDFIGFHGQTIFHNSKEKISKQLGDGKLLSKLTKKKVVYDFRQSDLKNEGEGAPLTPIFHKLIIEKKKIKLPVIIINLGGIANYTLIWQSKELSRQNHLLSADTGPGNCLIDSWIRKKTNMPYDKKGQIAKLGNINKEIFRKLLNAHPFKKSYDIKDFNLKLLKKLSLEDGAATLIEYTADSLIGSILDFLEDAQWYKTINILLCGGGRKNNFLVSRIKKKTVTSKTNRPVKLIDSLGIDGDFVESQAFGYLAIRSYLGLPISFPETTGCIKSCTGGVLTKNY
jgi:anhydro-N-acetylmuramic acid kinase